MFNTEDVFEIAGNILVERRGKTMPEDVRSQMMGRRAHEAFAILKEALGLSDSIDTMIDETKEIFYSHLDAHLQPMPGLFELLDLLEARNIPKCVATSSYRDYLLDLLKRFDLSDRFVALLSAEDVVEGKPNPEIYQKAAKSLQIAPQEMLVLEDSQAGTEAGAAAGAMVMSIPNRHTDMQDFSVATIVGKSLNDLVEML
ncbi:MAG: hydrolase [Planctomycetaceae bacterium]|nr:hydrolase [Planctomycetaceae bacterium]